MWLRGAILKVLEGFFEALAEGDLWFPVEESSGFGDVGAATSGVVRGKRLALNWRAGACDSQNLVGALEDSPLDGVADIDRQMFGGTGEKNNAFDKVGDVAEAASLGAITVDG